MVLPRPGKNFVNIIVIFLFLVIIYYQTHVQETAISKLPRKPPVDELDSDNIHNNHNNNNEVEENKILNNHEINQDVSEGGSEDDLLLQSNDDVFALRYHDVRPANPRKGEDNDDIVLIDDENINQNLPDLGLGNVNETVLINIDEATDYAKTSDIAHVMICSDSKTLGGMVTLVNSIQKQTSIPVFFHLLTTPEEVQHLKIWLLRYIPEIKVEIIPFTESMLKFDSELVVRAQLRQELKSPLNFARFILPDLLNKLDGKLLYIDDDTIVQGDIRDMWNIPIQEGHVIAAATDKDHKMEDYFNFDHAKIQELQIQRKDLAFNAGVFVCDIDAWRNHGVTDQLFNWVNLNNKENIYGGGQAGGASQPPMLIALHNKVSPLPPEWHMRHFGWWFRNRYKKADVDNAKLLHWNGGDKPWKKSSIGLKYADRWYNYYLPDPLGKFMSGKEIVQKENQQKT